MTNFGRGIPLSQAMKIKKRQRRALSLDEKESERKAKALRKLTKREGMIEQKRMNKKPVPQHPKDY